MADDRAGILLASLGVCETYPQAGKKMAVYIDSVYSVKPAVSLNPSARFIH